MYVYMYVCIYVCIDIPTGMNDIIYSIVAVTSNPDDDVNNNTKGRYQAVRNQNRNNMTPNHNPIITATVIRTT